MQQEGLFRGDFPFKQKSQEILKRSPGPWVSTPIPSPLKGSWGFLLGRTSRHLEAAPTSSSRAPGNPAQVPGSRSRVSLAALIWMGDGRGAQAPTNPQPPHSPKERG